MNDSAFIILAAARWVQFVSLFILFGVLLFPFYGIGASPAPCADKLAHRARKAVSIAVTAQALSLVLWLASSIASMGDGWTSLGDAEFVKAFFFETSFGCLWLARLLLTAILIGVLAFTKELATVQNLPTGVALVLAGALLASQAGIGHPAAAPAEERSLIVAGYALHVLGGAAWLGSLWPLADLLAEAKDGDDSHPHVRFVLARFSTMASIAVAMVVLGAAILLRPHLASPDFIASSPWGWAAAGKIALFGALIAIAWRNRFVLTPLFATQPALASKELLRNVIVDQGLTLVVLAAAAVIGIVSPSGS